MLSVDWFELVAQPARLFPIAADDPTPGVQPLVCCSVKQLKIFKSVVLLVSVSVMDLVCGRHGSVLGFPDNSVLELMFTVAPLSQVSIGRDVVTVRAFWFWSCFGHFPSFSVNGKFGGSGWKLGKNRAAEPESDAFEGTTCLAYAP